MKLKLNIEDINGTVNEVTVRPRTQVAFERHFSTPDHPVRLDDGVSMEHLYWLAWHSAKIGDAFDNWLEGIESVTPIVDEGDEVDGPLVEGQPSGISLPSPSNQGQASHSS